MAAPVNDVVPLEVVVGPVTVLDPDADELVNVPLLDLVGPPLGERVDVVNPPLGEEVMVAVTVVVVEAEPAAEDVVDAEPEVVVVEVEVELAAALEEEGVQFGRVLVPGKFPEPPSMMQFLEQAASPLVSEVWKHGAKFTPMGKSPARLSLQLPG